MVQAIESRRQPSLEYLGPERPGPGRRGQPHGELAGGPGAEGDGEHQLARPARRHGGGAGCSQGYLGNSLGLIIVGSRCFTSSGAAGEGGGWVPEVTSVSQLKEWTDSAVTAPTVTAYRPGSAPASAVIGARTKIRLAARAT